jgi:apolipoprotein D and lipocalin family protein
MKPHATKICLHSLLLYLAMLVSWGCAAQVQPVQHVEMPRLMGLWYEVAYGCKNPSSNHYAATCEFAGAGGDITLTKTWHWGSVYGRQHSESTRIRLDPLGAGKLSTAQGGSLWIIEMDSEYRYMTLGRPNHYELWIMSRTPAIPPAIYADMVKRAAKQGFNVKYLMPTAR